MAGKEVKLCLLGDSGVGKSSLAHRFVHENFHPSMSMTIGASFLTKTLKVNDRTFRFQIWDTAGQEKYRALAPMYYRGAAAAIVTYDITRLETYSTLKSWINELHRHGPSKIVIAVAGNKADLADQRVVDTREAEKYAQSVEAIFVETSAKTAANINALFHAIGERLPADDDSCNDVSTIQLKKQTSTRTKRKCC